MFKFGRKKETSENSSELTWSAEAETGLQQALAQAPVPSLLKNRVKHELRQAAEEAARAAGHTKVSAQDLMHGLLAKLPENMRSKVEEAMKKGPGGLKDLESELKG